MSEGGVAHGHQLDEEEGEGGHQGNALDPGIRGYGTGEAVVCQGFIGWCEELFAESARFSFWNEGRPTWMNAVAMMTPDPKYFAMKKAQSGTPVPGWRAAKTGKHAPVIARQSGRSIEKCCGVSNRLSTQLILLRWR